MSEEENFIARWSRRKLEDSERQGPRTPATDAASQDAPPAAQRDAQQPARSDAQPREQDVGGRPAAPAFDPATLPPLESITADSDVRAFLAPGVPAELTRAALRRAWAADPKIRDFVGLAENAWDFTAPDAIAGFGPLAMTDELKRAVANLVGRSFAAPASADPPPAPTADKRAAPPAQALDASSGSAEEAAPRPVPTDRPIDHSVAHAENIAPHNSTESVDRESDTNRPHGRALPK